MSSQLPEPEVARHARIRFAEVFGAGARVAVAPGRVNLIGEHTDYNDGFVLPMAIERAVAAAFAPRADRVLRAHAVGFGETRELALDALAPPGGSHWTAYVAGVAWALAETGFHVAGADLVIEGDVPIGAGLSSSAALEMAVARALAAASGLAWDPAAMARLGQRAENAYVGVGCGIMDQFAAAACSEGCALLLDCRSLEARPVRVPEAASVVVMDTGVRRTLASSAYNERRAACERAATALGSLDPSVRALRDADAELLDRGRHLMDELAFRRARHVVSEIRRPLLMAEALEAGDVASAGRLMDASHASLRDLYEVSCPELDTLVAAAREHPACHGARMTGAGFGGCAVALVETPAVTGFIERVREDYRSRTEREGAFFACRPAAGARIID